MRARPVRIHAPRRQLRPSGGSVAAARLILIVALGMLCCPLAAEAQQAGRVHRIGFLGATSPAGYASQLEAFRGGLRDLGYIEGKNVVIEFRWAEGNYARLPELAAELVRLKPDVLALPRLSRVGILLNPDNPANVATLRAMGETARSLKLQLQAVEVQSPAGFEDAFATLVKGRAGALAVYDDAMLIAGAARIADLARKKRLPTIGFIEYAKAGGLLAFGVNFPDLWRRAAGFVDKILKGAKPADLPVEQPTKFEVVVNLKTAKALGLTLPSSLLLRADSVIE